MKKLFCLLLCVLLMLSIIPVSASNAYGDAAARVASLRIINTQDPSATLTRGEAIFALMRLYVRGEMSPTEETSVFSDVAFDSALAPYSNYAARMGFVGGYGDGRLAPDESISLQQFVKVAVCALGYQSSAESMGGYPGGYMSMASKLGILKNIPGTAGALTYEQGIIIIDNMLDVNPLESVYGTGNFAKNELTLYELLQINEDLFSVSGLVTAVGKMSLNGYSALEKGEISVGGVLMLSNDFDNEALLGRYVTAYYRDGFEDGIPVAISIRVERRNEEITVNAHDIKVLNSEKCTYTDENGRKTDLRFENVQVIYNGRWYASPVVPVSGEITALDYDGDNKYELLFINEYESFIVEKTLEIAEAIYFKDGYSYRGKNSISFDLDDDDKEYEFLTANMEKASFSDIEAGNVVSIWADMDEEKVRVVICNDSVVGALESKSEETVEINSEEYYIYKPNLASFMAKYELGRSGSFALNHDGEIVEVVGELDYRINYGYALEFYPGIGTTNAQLQLVLPGTHSQKSKVSGNTETINRVYTNGEIVYYELDSTVKIYDIDGSRSKVRSKDLSPSMFDRAIVGYELSTEGKIKSLHNITTVPNYVTARDYELNGEIHSYSDGSDAFFIGESTQVIFVPDIDNPDEEDFEETITVNDGGDARVVSIAVDSQTQIAECSVVMVRLNDQNLTYETNDVSVVGEIRVKIDEDDNEIYVMDVLTGETVEQVYVEEDSDAASVAATLKKGDLIYYTADDNGKVTKIRSLLHLSRKLNNGYYTRLENQEGEEIYGKVTSTRFNFLSALENARVDEIVINAGNKEKYCTLLRKDGPMIYIYNRNDQLIYPGVPEAMQEGASEVFVYMGAPNTPAAVVIVKD